MIYYSILFLILACIAGVLGFVSLVGTAAVVSKVLFLLFLGGVVVTAYWHFVPASN